MRLAPAFNIASACSLVLIPPAAFTPILGPTISLKRRTFSTVAPAVPNPVEVLTKSAPAFFA